MNTSSIRKAFRLKSRLCLSAASLCLISGAAHAVPAVYFTDDVSAGQTQFMNTVLTANPSAIIFTYDLVDGSPASFAVTSGATTVYVRAARGGAPASYSSGGFSTWGVSYTSGSFPSVVSGGYTLEFFSDSGYTTPFITNAVGLQTLDWGTCCTGSNTTPTGAALGSAIYMVFDPATTASINLTGNITTPIMSTTHFVAAIDDTNSFSSLTLAPNGSGEFFGAGGYLVFSFVPIGSVPPGSGYVTVGSIPDIDLGGPYTTTQLNNGAVNPVFDGGILELAGGGTVTTAFAVNATNGTIDTSGNNAAFTGDFTGPGGLTKDGAGNLLLTGTNSFAGGLTIEEGFVVAGADGALGDAAGALTFDGGGLQTTASFTTARDTTLGAGDGTIFVDPAFTLTHNGEISGAGGLTKAGAGTLVLGGANNFAGGLLVDDGVVQIGADTALGNGGALTLDGGVLQTTGSFAMARDAVLGAGNGAFDTVGATMLTFNGAISGAGGLVKTGAGDLILGGANTFMGGVNVNDGTLIVGSNGAFGDSAGQIAFNGGNFATTATFTTARNTFVNQDTSFNVANGTTFTHDGVIGGAGNVMKTGGGDLVLNGANTFMGGVYIGAGALVVGSDAAFGDAAGQLDFNGGDLVTTASFTTERTTVVNSDTAFGVAGGTTFSHDGVIGGAGALVKAGSGVLALSGANAFAGGLFINEGTVSVEADDALGAAGGDITIDGGALSALASFTTNRNTVLGAGNGTVSTAASTTLTHQGDISGAGSLVKTGAGSLALWGDNAFSGVTVLEGNLYIMSDTDGSTFDVMSGGTLLGNGNLFGGATIHSGGALSPGASPGTMNVAGDVTQMTGSTFIVEIDGYGTGNGAGNFDRLILTGAGSDFTAAGTITPILRGISGPANNTFSPVIGDVFRVVETDGVVTGAFDTLLQPASGLASNMRFEILYGADYVELYIVPQLFDVLVTPLGRQNARRTAVALDSIRDINGAGPTAAASDLFVDLYGLDESQIAVAMHQLAGEIHAESLAAARRGSRMVRDGFMFTGPGAFGQGSDGACAAGVEDKKKLKACPDSQKAWIEFSGSMLTVKADAFSVGYEDERRAITAGVNLARGENSRLDLVGGYTRGDIATPGSGRGYVETWTAALRGAVRSGGFIADMAAGGTIARVETDRTMPIGGNNVANESDTDAHLLHADATLSYPIAAGRGLTLTPFVGASGEYTKAEGFAESGPAEYALTISEEDFFTAQTRAGAVLAQEVPFLGKPSQLLIRGAYARELGGASLSRQATLHGAGWETRSATLGTNLGEFAATWKVEVMPGVKAGIEYQGAFSGQSHDHQATVGLSLSW